MPWDRQVVMARCAELDLICPDCGQPRDESMADENLGPVPDYHAEAWRCRACHAKSAAASEMAGREDPDPLAGMKFSVHRNGSG